MEATIARTTVNDDAAAALRRGLGFAALFGLAGVAAIACTARQPAPAAGIATDRLLVQEALWSAEANGASALVFPQPLRARHGDPMVAKAMTEAQQRFASDRQAAAARRDAIVRRIDEARADRDLNESRNTVVLLKLNEALGRRAAAQQRNDRAALPALDAEVQALKADAVKVGNGAANASRTANALVQQIATLVATDRARAAQRLEDVRASLRGG